MDTTADPFRHQLTADLLRHAVSRAIFNQDDQNVADVRRSVYVELQDGTLGVVSGAAAEGWVQTICQEGGALTWRRTGSSCSVTTQADLDAERASYRAALDAEQVARAPKTGAARTFAAVAVVAAIALTGCGRSTPTTARKAPPPVEAAAVQAPQPTACEVAYAEAVKVWDTAVDEWNKLTVRRDAAGAPTVVVAGVSFDDYAAWATANAKPTAIPEACGAVPTTEAASAASPAATGGQVLASAADSASAPVSGRPDVRSGPAAEAGKAAPAAAVAAPSPPPTTIPRPVCPADSTVYAFNSCDVPAGVHSEGRGLGWWSQGEPLRIFTSHGVRYECATYHIPWGELDPMPALSGWPGGSCYLYATGQTA